MITDRYHLDVHPDLLESVLDYLNEKRVEDHAIFSYVTEEKKLLSMINEILLNKQTDASSLLNEKNIKARAIEMLDVIYDFSKRLDQPNDIFIYKEYFQKMFR
ncbi:hypothetical protein [Flammeovirga sp. SJP92]|uniref:hypothetical protein n=1 Tax=Flammeovirga sp. SJP92 TaxID=1775430 RepID=UPI0007888236|nr:hypothetical protein [Flammeovirga sp. SJP92]KXX71053.1 hypothetical protein AVL50_10650 [Flammeovirga sp. SJP92]